MEKQMSLFDLLPDLPPADHPDPSRFRYRIQASYPEGDRGFVILGLAYTDIQPRDLPDHLDLLLSMSGTDYELRNGMIPRGTILDVYFMPVDDFGELLWPSARALRVGINADDLYAAYRKGLLYHHENEH